MSQAFSKSPKHCAEKENLISDKSYKKLVLSYSAVFSSILFSILLIYLILHPAKPKFSIESADVYQFNLSGAHLLNSTIQLSLSSENPNRRVGICYNELQVYAAYKGQQIKSDASIPHFYQGHEDISLLTATLHGDVLPVSPFFAYEVGRDQMAGRLVLNLKVNGRFRWKVGTWVSGTYPINVNCFAFIPIRAVTPTGPLSSKETQCSTNI